MSREQRGQEKPGTPAEIVSAEALEWFVQLRDGIPTPAKSQRFEAWLEASSTHRKAYAEVEELWSDLGAIPMSGAMLRATAGAEAEKPPRRHRRWGGAIAASIALLLAINAPQMWASIVADQQTGTAEVRELTLGDGTKVALDAESAVDVAIAADRRMVRLLKGRAWFNVAHEARPFVVAVGGAEIRDIGTAFEVSAREGGGEVAVTDGVVELTAPGGGALRLVEGQTARFGTSGTGRLVESTPGAAPWRQGRLQFVDARLSDVLDDLARYGAPDVVSFDREVLDRRITGVINVADATSAQEAILARVGARGRRIGPWLLVSAGDGERPS